LEKEVKKLSAMMHTVVAHNRANGTFEFIGSPQNLDYGDRRGPSTVADIIDAI
jgi:hypothetical protein